VPDNQPDFQDLMLSGRYERALAVAEEAARVAREGAAVADEARAHVRQGLSLLMLDRNEEALGRAERAIAIAGTAECWIPASACCSP